jgi:hypothetical protein
LQRPEGTLPRRQQCRPGQSCPPRPVACVQPSIDRPWPGEVARQRGTPFATGIGTGVGRHRPRNGNQRVLPVDLRGISIPLGNRTDSRRPRRNVRLSQPCEDTSATSRFATAGIVPATADRPNPPTARRHPSTLDPSVLLPIGSPPWLSASLPQPSYPSPTGFLPDSRSITVAAGRLGTMIEFVSGGDSRAVLRSESGAR